MTRTPYRPGARGSLMVFVVGVLGFWLPLCFAVPARAQTVRGCSWTGPTPEQVLERRLPAIVLDGPLGVDLFEPLRRAGVPVALVVDGARGSEVSFESKEPVTVGEVLQAVLEQSPGFHLGHFHGKLVVYPATEALGTVVELGEARRETRAKAMVELLQQLEEEVPELDLGVTFRPLGGIHDDSIQVGGARTVIEHLVSLIADSPSLTFVVTPKGDGSGRWFSLQWAEVIEELRLEVPETMEVGDQVPLVTRVHLRDGSVAAMIGPDCEIAYTSSDPSFLEITDHQTARAVSPGRAQVEARYESRLDVSYIEVTRTSR